MDNQHTDEMGELSAISLSHKDFFSTLIDNRKNDLSELIGDENYHKNSSNCGEKMEEQEKDSLVTTPINDDNHVGRLIDKEREVWPDTQRNYDHWLRQVATDDHRELKNMLNQNTRESSSFVDDKIFVERQKHVADIELESLRSKNRHLVEQLETLRSNQHNVLQENNELKQRVDEAIRVQANLRSDKDLSEKQLSAQLRKSGRDNFRVNADLQKEKDARKNASLECDRLRQALDDAIADSELIVQREKKSWELQHRSRVDGLLAELENERNFRQHTDMNYEPKHEDGVEDQSLTSALKQRVMELESHLDDHDSLELLVKRQQSDNEKLMAVTSRQSEEISALTAQNVELCARDNANTNTQTHIKQERQSDAELNNDSIVHTRTMFRTLQEEINALRSLQQKSNREMQNTVKNALTEVNEKHHLFVSDIDSFKRVLNDVGLQYSAVEQVLHEQSKQQNKLQKHVEHLTHSFHTSNIRVDVNDDDDDDGVLLDDSTRKRHNWLGVVSNNTLAAHQSCSSNSVTKNINDDDDDDDDGTPPHYTSKSMQPKMVTASSRVSAKKLSADDIHTRRRACVRRAPSKLIDTHSLHSHTNTSKNTKHTSSSSSRRTTANRNCHTLGKANRLRQTKHSSISSSTLTHHRK